MGKTTTLHKKWHPTGVGSFITVYPVAAKRKKLLLTGAQKNKRETKELILDSVIHELQNCLQSIGMGVDLLQLSQTDQTEYHAINSGIERASKLLREMQEYFFPPDPSLSTRNLSEVIGEAIHKVEKESGRENIYFPCPESLLSLHYDWSIVSRVLDRVLRCACGLLSHEEGEIMVSVSLNEELPPVAVEIKIEICGASSLPIAEEKIFTPCWRANDYQAGLGLVLARQAVQRRGGELTFKQINSSRAHFTLRLEVLPENILSKETSQETGICLH
jgi:K+-sensing histidine kinase KdpD